MEFMGFLVVTVITALAGAVVKEFAATPEFVNFLASFSPWMAEHSVVIGWLAVAVVLLSGAYIPYAIVMKGDYREKENGLSKIGNLFGTFSLVYTLIFLLIPGIAYLLGIGWFGARKVFGY